MSKMVNKLITRYGRRISSLAVSIATLSPKCCRGEWYQPKEPDNLSELVKNNRS